MTDDLLPKTPNEAESLMFQAILIRAYADLAKAATGKQLTEHDIAVIQRNAIDELRDLDLAAHEFSTFELEKSVAQVRAGLGVFFDDLANGRARNHPR